MAPEVSPRLAVKVEAVKLGPRELVRNETSGSTRGLGLSLFHNCKVRQFCFPTPNHELGGFLRPLLTTGFEVGAYIPLVTIVLIAFRCPKPFQFSIARFCWRRKADLRNSTGKMGALKYLEEFSKKKQSDAVRFLLRVRCWEVS